MNHPPDHETVPLDLRLPAADPALEVPWRRSLWLRLAIVVAAVMAVILGGFLYVTQRVLVDSGTRTGAERALTAATQMAGVIGQNNARSLADLQRFASDPQLLQFVIERTPDAGATLDRRLRTLLTPGQPIVAVQDSNGAVLLEVRTVTETEAASGLATPSGRPGQIGLGPVRESNGIAYADVVAELRNSAAGAPLQGYLTVRRTFVGGGTNANVVSRLVGAGATAAFGNRGGDVWTDYSRIISRPPIETTQRGTQIYDRGDVRHLAAVAPIDGTPWAVWIDVPQAAILSPVRLLLRRMALVAAAAALFATIGVAWALARALKPLDDLTVATEAMAAGEYGRRIVASRPDEVGRLAAAFNTMSDRVTQTHQELEARVQRRTARLEETRDLLETQVAALKKAQTELDQFFALSPDLLRISGANGEVLRMNDAWTDVLGWDTETFERESTDWFIHPDDRARTTEARQTLRRAGTVRLFENRYRCKDGSYRWLSWRAVANIERGVIYSTARDITERKRTERQLEQRAAELSELNAELEMFSYSVSHDLRAPLRHVQGFATLLVRSPTAQLGETDRRWLSTIDAAATRMSTLIDDLLLFSRTGRAELRKVPVDVATIVNEAREELSSDPHCARVRWVVESLPRVDADPALLRLVFINLLSNALKYTRLEDNATITVGTAPGEAFESVIFVRDNGVGFDMQYASKLFGVFQRLHTDTQFEGTGIGLANVRRIVQRHGGRVWAEAAVNKGATFYVALPSDSAA